MSCSSGSSTLSLEPGGGVVWAGIAIQNCPKIGLEAQDIKLPHLSAIRYRPPQKVAWLRQGSSVAEAITRGWQQQLEQWAFPCRVTWATYLRIHQKGERNPFLHAQGPWPSELEKKIIITLGIFHGSVPSWDRLLRMRDVWVYIHTQERRGREAACQATLCSQVGKVTVTKSERDLSALKDGKKL